MVQAKHALITGDSGGGKTTLMREYHAEWDGVSIWINHNNETVPGGNVATNFQELVGMVRSGKQHINYRADQLEGVQHARSIGYHETVKPTQIIVDEIHNVWPKDGEVNAVKTCLHEDRDTPICLRFATQDPQDLKPYTPLKQAKFFVWCGQWNGFHDGFFNAHPWFPRSKLPEKQHEYVVISKQGEVLYRNETKEKYA